MSAVLARYESRSHEEAAFHIGIIAADAGDPRTVLSSGMALLEIAEGDPSSHDEIVKSSEVHEDVGMV